MKTPVSTDSFYLNSALTYFEYGSDYLIDNNQVFEKYNGKSILRYPNHEAISKSVMLKKHHFDFWETYSKYLPKGSYISNAYVSPEYQAKKGLELLLEKQPTVDLGKYKLSKSNPELIGMFNGHYLFEFDYNKVANSLKDYGIFWAKPNCSVHQRGLAIDIRFNVADFDTVSSILKWIVSSGDAGLSGVLIKTASNEIHIEFSDSVLLSNKPITNTFLIENKFNDVVSEVLKDKSSRIYDILKQNGHADLSDMGYDSKYIATLPENARNINSRLSNAINDIFADILGGPNGLISSYVQAQVEYPLALANGAIGAVLALSDELDRLTGGRASNTAREAIMSEVHKTPLNTFIKNTLDSFDSIDENSNKVFAVKEARVGHIAKISSKKSDVALAKSNLLARNGDTINTSTTEKDYDRLRVTDLSKIVNLEYDHYYDIDDIVDSKVIVPQELVTNVFNITSVNIIHGFTRDVTVKAYDLNGNQVIGSIENGSDMNNVTVSFNNTFTGKIVIY